jgi:uncharacterized membrane protein
MIRDHLVANAAGTHNGVPWRSHEVARIEALSDAVFAFAVTLLIVALEVPETFGELWAKMHGFVAFAIGFAILFHVWYNQHSFFRRFGLQDAWTIVLNGALLFLILFYVYPLKFLFTLLVSEFMGEKGMIRLKDGQLVPMLESAEQARTMMVIYGAGFASVFGIFVLLYFHALRQKEQLSLSEQEQFDARESLEQNAIMVLIGLASMTIAHLSGNISLAGVTYVLIGPAITIQRTLRGRQRRRKFGR